MLIDQILAPWAIEASLFYPTYVYTRDSADNLQRPGIDLFIGQVSCS